MSEPVVTNIGQILDRIENIAREQELVSLGNIVETVGGRSFGPLLLVVGIITTSPLGGIPGMPTIMGVMVVMIAGQLLFRKQHVWFPRWLLRRSLARDKVLRGLRWLRPAARLIDRVLRPRLQFFVQGVCISVIAALCSLIAIALPVMELVPFSAHGAGISLTGFGLALTARDGLLALCAGVVTVVTFGSVIYQGIT